MHRADEVGLREGWRGAVAYAASPSLWREGSFVAFAVVMVVLSVAWTISAITRADGSGAKVVNGLVTGGLVALVIVWPIVRAWRRRFQVTSS